ncbi:MAG: HAMP domain-containing histidine kinase [Chloroflexi bacterium]|nr:HAMP domain-containing histidine kinase [Chloroflexota bacterium]MYI04472.1 HAMP domain-containing histidine kinase [Chloroflexota bacterium]
MIAGYGLRLFLGFAGIVLVMLGVSAAVFFSLFGGYREDIDRSELRTAGNALGVEILRNLRQAEAVGRDELLTMIHEQAEHAGLIVIITDGRGRVLSGFEPAWGGRGGSTGIRYADIVQGSRADGWLDTILRVDGKQQAALARVMVAPQVASGNDGDSAVLMAVTFGEGYEFSGYGELVGRLLVAGLAGLVVAVLVAMILSRQLMRPLQALTAVVRGFGPDRYDMRASESGPTQVRELAAAFNAMAERISDNERAMRGFIADLSHELRTPLTSIRGFVEALRDGTVTDPVRRESSLEVIHDETRRMLRMIEQLLDLSRLEAGHDRLEQSRIELEELFAHVESIFESRARDAGVGLRAEIAAGPTAVEADFDRLVQVLNNLVDNALRHTAEGEIVLSAAESSGGIEIIVRDTGEGIATEHLDHLFDRFWQPESRSGPGAGLGLAISREIVRAHGGSIQAASEVGVGTTITVWLPAP